MIDSFSRQVRSETPSGSKFHLGSVLLPEKDEIRFQSAGGSGPVSQRRVNSSKRSSSALSDRDHEMHVSFDERKANVSCLSNVCESVLSEQAMPTFLRIDLDLYRIYSPGGSVTRKVETD